MSRTFRFFSKSLNNVNVIFCSWLLPPVALGPGSSLHCAGAVDASYYRHLPLQVRQCPSWGHLGSQHIPPPCRVTLPSPVPACPDSGCGWLCSISSKRICWLHHPNMNQLCETADIYWDVHFCPVSHFRCYICTLGCSCPRVSILVLFSYVS